MLNVKIPFTVDTCHNFNEEMIYHPVAKKFLCQTCKSVIDYSVESILLHWCDLWVTTLESNRLANIFLVSDPNEINIKQMFCMNSFLQSIEQEIILYLQDGELRYKILSGPNKIKDGTPQQIVDNSINWAKQIVHDIRLSIKDTSK